MGYPLRSLEAWQLGSALFLKSFRLITQYNETVPVHTQVGGGRKRNLFIDDEAEHSDTDSDRSEQQPTQDSSMADFIDDSEESGEHIPYNENVFIRTPEDNQPTERRIKKIRLSYSENEQKREKRNEKRRLRYSQTTESEQEREKKNEKRRSDYSEKEQEREKKNGKGRSDYSEKEQEREKNNKKRRSDYSEKEQEREKKNGKRRSDYSEKEQKERRKNKKRRS